MSDKKNAKDMTGCEQLAEAFAIFGKYTGTGWPTHCEHDIMIVAVSPENVSEEDRARLKELHFNEGSDFTNDCFSSHRFGSC